METMAGIVPLPFLFVLGQCLQNPLKFNQQQMCIFSQSWQARPAKSESVGQ